MPQRLMPHSPLAKSGGSCGHSGTRGRVVLLVGGQATIYDNSGSAVTFVV